MITKEVTDTLYKQYKKPPKSTDMLDLALLFDLAATHHNLYIDPETEDLTIGSVEEYSPFRRLPMRHIHAIVPFEEWVAIVLHSSVIFLNRKNEKVAVHIKPDRPGLLSRIFG